MSDARASRPVLEDVSVVIPTLGRETLVECLARIADGDAWPDRVILVDQGDQPRVAEWVAGQTGVSESVSERCSTCLKARRVGGAKRYC